MNQLLGPQNLVLHGLIYDIIYIDIHFKRACVCLLRMRVWTNSRRHIDFPTTMHRQTIVGNTCTFPALSDPLKKHLSTHIELLTFIPLLINICFVKTFQGVWGSFKNYRHTHQKRIWGQLSVTSKRCIYKISRNITFCSSSPSVLDWESAIIFNIFFNVSVTSNLHLWFKFCLMTDIVVIV